MISRQQRDEQAAAVMTLDIVQSVLQHPEDLSHVVNLLMARLREISGAQTVVFFRTEVHGDTSIHHVIGVMPKRRDPIGHSEEAGRLASLTMGSDKPIVWRTAPGGDEPAMLLEKLGYPLGMAVPLSVGSARVGTMLVLGLVDDAHIAAISRMLDALSDITALVLHNSFLIQGQREAIASRDAIAIELRKHQERLEELVRDRTSELERLNAELQRRLIDLEQTEERLRQSQKLEAVGTLAGGIAHDFNNILGAILGYAEIAQLELSPSNPVQAAVGEIISAARRAASLVRQILAFGRKTRQQRRPLLLQTAVQESLQLLRSTLPATVEIRQSIDPQCGPVLADATQIHQVVVNLCTNAFQALPEQRGVVEITVKELEDNEGIADLGSGPYAKLSVQDSGKGMNEAVLQRIFEPYFTTKSKGQGTGLGLAMVHGIVKSHDGGITVSSRPGFGSTFDVYLPICKPDASTARSVQKSQAAGGNEHVLVVDDEESLVRLSKLFLERMGYRVTAFTDSAEALVAFAAAPERFDAIVLDLTMPKLTGLEFAERVVEIRPDVPLILCTGYGDSMDKARAGTIAFSSILQKPVSREALVRSVRQSLDARHDRAPRTGETRGTRSDGGKEANRRSYSRN